MLNKNFKEEKDKLFKEMKDKDEQTYKDYPEYPKEQRQGLDAGNPILRKKLSENMKWFYLEAKKLKEKYNIE